MRLDIPKGTKDYFGKEAAILDKIIHSFRRSFRLFGFEYIKTPTFEYASILKNKYGEDSKLIYEFEDKNKRKLALRYDLTVPLARVVGTNNFPQPSKFYNIGSVFRYDRPQKGRKREFIQADIDIIGDDSINSDAELIACMSNGFYNLNLSPTFRINNRAIMEKIFKNLNIQKSQFVNIFRSIDKLDKIGYNGVISELKKIGIKEKKLFDIIKIKGDFKSVNKKLENLNLGINLEEFDSLIKKLNEIKINEINVVFDLSLARGLDYYTGNVWEIDSGKGLSIGGGGRYNNLIKGISNKDITGVGISVGITRIAEIIKLNPDFDKKIFVIDLNNEANSIIRELRRNGIKTSYNLKSKNIKSSINYANKNNFEYVLIIGDEEIKSNNLSLKNIKTGKSEKIKIKDLISKFK